MIKLRIIPIILLFTFVQCATREKDAIAEIDGESIATAEVDGAIQNRLYAKLYDVYKIRMSKLEEVLSQKLLEKEAVNRDISVDSLLKVEVYGKLSDTAMAQMIRENDLTLGVPDPNAPGKIMDLQSERAKEHLKGVFLRKTQREFVEKLKIKYNAKVLLHEPLPPPFDLSEVKTHPLNEISSSLEIIIVSDFECETCRQEYPTIKAILKKYKNTVSFKFAHLSDSTNFPMLFAECASNRTNFYGIYNAMFESIQANTINYSEVSRKLNLDEAAMRECMLVHEKEMNIAISKSMNTLKKTGIVYTPTLLIDKREYFGAFDFENISEYIDRMIQSKK